MKKTKTRPKKGVSGRYYGMVRRISRVDSQYEQTHLLFWRMLPKTYDGWSTLGLHHVNWFGRRTKLAPFREE